MLELVDQTEDHDRPPRVDCRFIPVRPAALAAAIDRDPETFGELAGRAEAVLRALDRVIEQEVSALHEVFDDLYVPFNPDEDTPPEMLESSAESRGEPRLLAYLDYLLDKANFKALGQRETEAAIQAATTYGVRVRVDPACVDHLSLHVRGHDEETFTRRSRRKPWQWIEIPVPIYRRLVVATRLRGEVSVRLKLFRDIPVRDVEALMPHAQVKMSLFDQVQVFGAGAGALGGFAYKAFGAITTGVVSIVSLASAAAIGFGGLAFRSFFGYRRTKRMRTGARTQHLYERKLANNASAVHALLRMIRKEELKEAMAAYAVLVASRDRPPTDETELDQRVESWLERTFGYAIDFDCPDALETLDRLGLWEDRATLRVVQPGSAIEMLQQHWRDRRSERYHLMMVERRRHAAADATPAPQQA